MSWVAGPGSAIGAPVSMSNNTSAALNTLLQRPQRTQPSDACNWSSAARNTVPQAEQRVARVMGGACRVGDGLKDGLAAGCADQAGRCAVIRIQPSSLSLTSSDSQGA